ncbi:hypothetical protein O181_015939 [Austropuccinia psidii MF-1]|uniref:Integrase catalytic domain-containing protein n=1 Tax=Austropuccinia psidii MF-1 TaxID=1389203 RepID=A0A9Q3C2W8_9BASI|nr:hypothetical protein [Austropuccinia psidii MF-1]
MIHIKEPKYPWEVVYMDWVTALPTSGDKSYNSCLVILDKYSKAPIFLSCNKDDTAMDTALILSTRVISHTGVFQNIISDRDPKFTSALCTNINRLFETKLSFSTAYNPQTDGLAERMIKNLEDIIKRFFAYGLKFKDSDGFTHYWCTLIPSLELEHKTSVYSSTGQTPAITNAFQVELSGELENEHPTFQVRMIKTYQPADKELFPLRNPTPLTVPPVEQNEDKNRKKTLNKGNLGVKDKENI